MGERQGIKSLIGFGQQFFPVLREMSFSLKFDRRLAAIVAPNGAGKTTLLRAIAGAVPSSGLIDWCGQAVGGLTSWERSKLGITFVPHGSGIFPSLTVNEHFQLADRRWRKTEIVIEELHDRVRQKDARLESSLIFLRGSSKAGNLSGGEQKILSLIRLLFRKWSLILLDEPTAGLSPTLIGVYSVILEMLQPSYVLKAEQYSRVSIARSCGATLYELRESSLEPLPEALKG
jgi:branched-chain amino acid transport system ATP-binding protein